MKKILCLLIRISMIPTLIRELVQSRYVTIITYHDVSPQQASKHFNALKSRYNIIPLRDYIQARRIGTLKGLPRKSLIITIDDGQKGNYRLRDVIESSGVPVTVFLTSSIVGTNRHFWFKHAEGKIDSKSLERVPDEERLNRLKEHGYTDETEFGNRVALSSEEIEDMRPLVDFQSHTATHPILPECDDNKAAYEIKQSKIDLETRYGLDIYALCYPNGDYSLRDFELLKEAGYECGLTIDNGFNSASTDLFRLKRICISDIADVNQLLVTACGIWHILRNWVKHPSYGFMDKP